MRVGNVDNQSKRFPPITYPIEIVLTFFSQHPETTCTMVSINAGDISLVPQDEILDAAKKVRDNAALGIDLVFNKTMKLAIKTAPSMFTRVFLGWLTGDANCMVY